LDVSTKDSCGLVVLAPVVQEAGEVVHARERVRVLEAEGFLPELQRLLVYGLGLPPTSITIKTHSNFLF
jgi:hypothetical protein